MKVAILGIDGYIGWTLALRLIKKGHQVVGVDSLYTRMRVKEVGSDSVTDPDDDTQHMQQQSQVHAISFQNSVA